MLMGRRMAENGIVCVCVDYRNFPQARVGGMLEDVRDACVWLQRHIVSFGGDPDRMWLVGQSAGAHLASLFLLLQAKAWHALAPPVPAAVAEGSPVLFRRWMDTVAAEAAAAVAAADTTQRMNAYLDLFATSDEVRDSDPRDTTKTDGSSVPLLARGGSHHHSGVPSLPHMAVLASLPRFRGLIGISGPYEISPIYLSFLERRGINSRLLRTIFDRDASVVPDSDSAPITDEELRHVSPTCLARHDLGLRESMGHRLPQVCT
jgi:acetyl esterase/lipase